MIEKSRLIDMPNRSLYPSYGQSTASPYLDEHLQYNSEEGAVDVVENRTGGLSHLTVPA